MVKTKLKNVLMQYQGGGYDGCIWEWNFCYFDKNGEFHDIFSSGYAGCETKEQAENYLETAKDRYNKVFLYKLSKPAEVEEFVTESNEGHVIGVAKWLYDNFQIEIKAACSCCKEKSAAHNFYPEGITGAGGIAFKYTEMICEDCLSMYTCSHCGEFFGADHNFVEIDGCDACGYCAEDLTNEN